MMNGWMVLTSLTLHSDRHTQIPAETSLGGERGRLADRASQEDVEA